jgi:hypothetical protein
MTGKIEKDLNQAQYSIELMRMLKEKTEGNLSDDELKTIDSAIYDAQMNYLEESNKEQQEKKEPEEKAGEKAAEDNESKEDTDTDTPAENAEKKEE